jgi:hypothetical protein
MSGRRAAAVFVDLPRPEPFLLSPISIALDGDSTSCAISG